MRFRCIVFAAEMHLCQLMFIGDAELAGDLFEIAGLLVSKLVRAEYIRKYYQLLKFGKLKFYTNKVTPVSPRFKRVV